MPEFPGMGYPLVPGYESVGQIVDAGADASARVGEWVFVPGANCFADARGLFGGTAQQLVVPSARALSVPQQLGANGVLCALAATAYHAIDGGTAPDLIIGHGVLGRLIARICIAQGGAAPTVWETNRARYDGADGYRVTSPDLDDRRDYASIYDASGDADIFDSLIGRLSKGGEVTLAGFYTDRINFAKEARLRIAAEWQPDDMGHTMRLIESGALKLDGLISDLAPACRAEEAYPKAFTDPDCLKMVLDWSEAA